MPTNQALRFRFAVAHQICHNFRKILFIDLSIASHISTAQAALTLTEQLLLVHINICMYVCLCAFEWFCTLVIADFTIHRVLLKTNFFAICLSFSHSLVRLRLQHQQTAIFTYICAYVCESFCRPTTEPVSLCY